MILAGFDVGTTAVKGIYFDARRPARRRRGVVGVRAASARERAMPNRIRPTGSPGCSACRDAARRARSRCRSVAAIGICSQVNTHVFVDADLTPVYPAINWQDQRCAGAAAELERRAGDDKRADLRRAVRDRCLLRPEPSAVAAAARIRDAWDANTLDPVAEGLLRRRPHRRRSARTAVSPVGLVGADGEYLAELPLPSSTAPSRGFRRSAEFDAPAGRTTGASDFPPAYR